MYMKVHEFRKDLKQAFDSALRGEEVQIERGGVVYQLTAFGVVGQVIAAAFPTYSENVPVNTASVTFKRQANGACKIHGTPLDDRKKCLTKGCRYA